MDYRDIYYPESKFGGFTDIDGTITFYIRINALVNPGSVVLDVGCGRAAYAEDSVAIRRDLRIFKGKCSKVIGIDVDEHTSENPALDEFRLIKSPEWPLGDETVDVCICDYVLEHVEDPESFFAECRRVIKPNGYLCIRTPNAYSYIALLSKLIPNRLHTAVLGRVQSGRKEEDVFPTRYRCNTKARIRHLLNSYGFDHCVYQYEAEPMYLSFSRWAYGLGTLYQHFIPNIFKSQILAFARKN